jgi:protein-disulfide isomerase
LSAPSGRRETKRERTERMLAQRAAEQAAQRRRERVVRIGAAVAVALVVLGVVLFMVTRGSEEAPENAALPDGVQAAGGGIPVGTAEGPVLELYEDFQCPICATFEQALGDTLGELVTSGSARIVYFPLSFLDRQLGNDSSLRAANAAGCTQDAGAFAAYHDTVFANQPEREGEGYTDEQLLEFGRQAGIEGDEYAAFESCVRDLTYEGWVQQVQQAANDRPVTGTPTLFIDGELVDTADLLTGDSYDPEKLRALVEAAA